MRKRRREKKRGKSEYGSKRESQSKRGRGRTEEEGRRNSNRGRSKFSLVVFKPHQYNVCFVDN